jgi:polyribonucleotide nucleotidyltransferase
VTTPDGFPPAPQFPAAPQFPQVGDRFLGTVVKTAAFGALVRLPTGGVGVVRVAEIRRLYRGRAKKNTDEMIGIGDQIPVEVVEVDNHGKVTLMPVPPPGR